VYEEKVDGWRVLAYKSAAGVRLISRNGRELTRRFPELAAAVAALAPPTLILDGEIAVFDQQLLSHFEWIRAQPKDVPTTPPTLIAFDCLYARGKDLRTRALRVRRNSLTASSGCFRRGGSPTTASRPGFRCSSAAMRGWSVRTRPRPTSRAAR
jgi:bifunctional non-homologous end joining protein LigD